MPEPPRFAVQLLFAAAFLLSGAPAFGVSISSVSGTASGVVTQANGGPVNDHYVSAAFSEDCGAGCTDFLGSLQAGAGLEADNGENLRIDVEWTYTVDIVVDATATEAWELSVDLDLLGYLTLVDQGGGVARARFFDVVGTLNSGGTGFTGSMDLNGSLDVNTGSGANQILSRMGSFTVVGGFGPDTVSMTFTMDGQLRSRCTGGGCSGQGDEAAIRLGLPSAGTPPGFTAGNYPGIDGDPGSAHGLFLDVSVIPLLVPEPGAAWLLGSALLAGGWLRRRRARSRAA